MTKMHDKDRDEGARMEASHVEAAPAECMPPEVAVMLSSVSRALGFQLAAARGVGDLRLAALIVSPDVDWPLTAAPHETRRGVQCAVLPMGTVFGIAAVCLPAIAHRLAEPVAPGLLWCLVIWRLADEERALLVPMRPLTAPMRGMA